MSPTLLLVFYCALILLGSPGRRLDSAAGSANAHAFAVGHELRRRAMLAWACSPLAARVLRIGEDEPVQHGQPSSRRSLVDGRFPGDVLHRAGFSFSSPRCCGRGRAGPRLWARHDHDTAHATWSRGQPAETQLARRWSAFRCTARSTASRWRPAWRPIGCRRRNRLGRLVVFLVVFLHKPFDSPDLGHAHGPRWPLIDRQNLVNGLYALADSAGGNSVSWGDNDGRRPASVRRLRLGFCRRHFFVYLDQRSTPELHVPLARQISAVRGGFSWDCRLPMA